MRGQLMMVAAVLVMAGVCRGDAAVAQRKALGAFGISVVPPAGWVEQVPETLNEVIGWTQPVKAGEKAGAITVRCEPAKGDLDKNAADLAVRYGGAVRDEKVMLDGEQGRVIWISRAGVAAEMRGIVAQHNGLAYVVECTAPTGSLPQEAFEAFAKDVKWSQLEAITDHLKGDGPWMSALGGKVVLQGPEIMRPAAPEAMQRPDRFLMMTGRSKGSDAEFICVVQWGPALDTRSFAEVSAALLTSLNNQDKAAGFKWNYVDGQRRMSNLASMTKTDPTGQPYAVNTIIGIAKIDGLSQYVVVNFLVHTDDAGKQKAYEAAAKRIMDSIKAGKQRGQ